jgi:LuxR family maltose regulon positive regulatory protein
VIGGWVHALNGRAAATDRLADLFEAAAYPGVPPPGAESYETARGALRALMARAGLAAAIDEAERAVALEPRSSAWRPIALAVLGSALAVGGDRERSDVIYRETIEVAPESGAGRALATAWSGRAILAIERADWASAHAFARRGMEAVDRYGLTGDVTVAWAAAVAARAALDRGAADEARRHLARFQVARPALSVATPWLSARCLLEASRAVLANADPAGARALLFQAEDILVRRADLGDLPDQVAALRKRIRDLPPGPGGASTLTPAEIRVLRLLPTYLSVPEIAHRLFVTPNTIRTQIQAIYGKLGASSRSEAVERAVEVGLVEPLPILADDEITRP